MLSSRAPIGYLGINEVPVSINQGIIAMICDKMLPNYYMLFWAMNNLAAIKSKAGGTTFAEISKKNFRTIPIVIPSEEAIGEFSGQADALFQMITNNVRANDLLAEIRDTLLPKLISGEIRIPDAESLAEEATA